MILNNPIPYFLMFIHILLLGGCNKSLKSTNQRLSENVKIYFGGDILTMEGDKPTYTEALAIQDGKILWLGSKADLIKKYQNAEKIELTGKTMLPGFIDAHGHIFLTGFPVLFANLFPYPDGEVNDIAALLKKMNDWQTHNQKLVDKLGLIIGFGYDDSQLTEKKHPTATDLDKISSEIPIIIIHRSGHSGVMNHKALELINYTAATPNPAGGVIHRESGSLVPNGVLEEMAFIPPILKLTAKFDQETNELIAKAALKVYAQNGFTTAQEGRAFKNEAEVWKSMAEKDELPLDVAVYPDIQRGLAYLKENSPQAAYRKHFRIAGGKIGLDGSIQLKTAWLSSPYLKTPEGQSKDYKGYPAFGKDEVVFALVDSAFKYNWQVLTHCNGDASADQYIRAVRQAANKFGNKDRRSVMIHAQTIREDQLDSMKVLGIIPSYFGLHTFLWGDWHRQETLGEERTKRISPTQSTLKRNMIFTQHHDSPVAMPNALMILYAQVNRKTRTNVVVGEDQKVDIYTALKSITSWAAYQYFEEASKGSIKVGKLADLVILDKNPLKVPSTTIKDIQVLETIKEGKTIYQKK